MYNFVVENKPYGISFIKVNFSINCPSLENRFKNIKCSLEIHKIYISKNRTSFNKRKIIRKTNINL